MAYQNGYRRTAYAAPTGPVASRLLTLDYGDKKCGACGQTQPNGTQVWYKRDEAPAVKVRCLGCGQHPAVTTVPARAVPVLPATPAAPAWVADPEVLDHAARVARLTARAEGETDAQWVGRLAVWMLSEGMAVATNAVAMERVPQFHPEREGRAAESTARLLAATAVKAALERAVEDLSAAAPGVEGDARALLRALTGGA